MSKEPKPGQGGKARAAAIRAEIEKLTSGGAQAGEKEESRPDSPRDFIQRWMAEHDKKSKDK